MDIEKIHKLREQCLVRFPLRINQYNHYIEDANGCVIAVVYGTAGNAAPYLVEAANALPELLDEVERLREEVRQLNKIATIAGEWLVEAVRRGE